MILTLSYFLLLKLLPLRCKCTHKTNTGILMFTIESHVDECYNIVIAKPRQKKSHDRYVAIPDFEVSTAILNTTYIFRNRFKLNFGPLRSQVKSRYFPEKMVARRYYIYFLYKYLGIIGRKRLGQPFRMIICIYHYLLNKTRLDLDLDNFYWIRKIHNFATNNINFWFSTHHT